MNKKEIKIDIYGVTKNGEHNYLCSTTSSKTCTEALNVFAKEHLNLYRSLNRIKTHKKNKITFVGEVLVFGYPLSKVYAQFDKTEK